jgi:hypothetical protein
VKDIVPVSAAIVALLTIVYFSYRQTIEAYPHGGGSYTVASENLGEGAGLLAAAALMIDYVLTAAVGISAGVGALISAAPSLQPHTLALPGILALLTLVNMRGVHDTGVVFMIPTYLFTDHAADRDRRGRLAVLHTGGHPHPVTPLPAIPPATEMIQLVAAAQGLLFRLHGHDRRGGGEQRRDGLPRRHAQERQDHADHHHRAAGVLLLGIALLCRGYGIAPPIPTGGYESVLSMLTRAVMGHGWFYYLTIASVLLVLALSANTAFADFPRLTRAIALDNYMPHVFSAARPAPALLLGNLRAGGADRAAADHLWRRHRPADSALRDRRVHGLYALAGRHGDALEAQGQGSRLRMFVNGVGAVATGITTLVVLVAKFVEGAWITALLIRHDPGDARGASALRPRGAGDDLDRPIDRPCRWSGADCGDAHRPLEPHLGEGALAFALSLSTMCAACMCRLADEPDPICTIGRGCCRSAAAAASRAQADRSEVALSATFCSRWSITF